MILLNPFVSFGSSLDADAQAFLTATGITDPTQSAAINQLVLDLKSAGLWSKMYALYPMVGGTATKHKYNLKDPQDTDGAFRIVWTGTVTHNANGVLSDGATGYGDTKFTPSTTMPSNGGSMGVWVDDSGAVAQCAIGCQTTGGSQVTQVAAHWSDGKTYPSINGASTNFTYVGTGSSLIQVVRTDSTNCFYQTGTTRTNFTGAFSAPTHAVFVLALNNAGTPAFYNFGQPIKFAYLGDTLNTTESDAMFNAVSTYQTALGR